MFDCPRCAQPLPLTRATCACGADVPSAAEGVGLACGACDAWNAPGEATCSACGSPLSAGGDLPTLELELAPEGETEPETASPESETEPGTELDAAELAMEAEVEPEPPSSPSRPVPSRPEPPTLQRTGRARGAAIRHARPADGAAALRVTTVRPDGSTAAVVLGAAPVLCGRSDSDLLVPGETVSRHHARFVSIDGRITVEDLGSLNGTWIRLRAPRAIRYGDELRLAERRLRLAYTASGAALEEIATAGATLAVHPLRAGATLVGAAGDVRLDGLEPQHARIEATAAGHAITDLESRTGTWLRLAAPEPIAAGDELLLGAERLRVVEG